MTRPKLRHPCWGHSAMREEPGLEPSAWDSLCSDLQRHANRSPGKRTCYSGGIPFSNKGLTCRAPPMTASDPPLWDPPLHSVPVQGPLNTVLWIIVTQSQESSGYLNYKGRSPRSRKLLQGPCSSRTELGPVSSACWLVLFAAGPRRVAREGCVRDAEATQLPGAVGLLLGWVGRHVARIPLTVASVTAVADNAVAAVLVSSLSMLPSGSPRGRALPSPGSWILPVCDSRETARLGGGTLWGKEDNKARCTEHSSSFSGLSSHQI